ncbi:hypothetical protein Y032_0278g1162 [Ancylostoma ceylanicum]|uniref:Uncharacterized protein n=1 Tax=Ancylostoma ceylanicum TaxID=53326 RepID=A0A016S731_9BILA|nr:hypothetical protein Y032_0278g1162 [Ancylostoma ceylanicum]
MFREIGRHTKLAKWVAIQTLPNGSSNLTKCVFMQALINALSYEPFSFALHLTFQQVWIGFRMYLGSGQLVKQYPSMPCTTERSPWISPGSANFVYFWMSLESTGPS